MGAIYTRTCKANRGKYLCVRCSSRCCEREKEGEKCSGLILEIGDKKTCGFATKKYFTYIDAIYFRVCSSISGETEIPLRGSQKRTWEQILFLPPPFAACGLLGKSSFLPRFPHIHTGTYAHEEKESHGIKTLFKATNRLCRYTSYKYQKAF